MDGIPPYIIKGCQEWLKQPLLQIFNCIIGSTYFPEIQKMSVHTPIHKSGARNEIENYRGVSIMCAPAKLFEPILHAHIYKHVKNSIVEQQHGFMSGRSINTNLMMFAESVNDIFENGCNIYGFPESL